MPWELVAALVAGAVIATVTTPVGVSGAVFLLPVQLDVLGVPNPAVTPTNLLYNVVGGPAALLRHLRAGSVDRSLTVSMLLGSVPGVVVGAVLRVLVLPDPRPFRILAGAVLVPLGAWLLWRALVGRPGTGLTLRPRTVTALALGVGVVGGLYGIGGGSLLAPLLVGRGHPVARVAPAALASTLVASVVGTAAFAVLALTRDGSVAPDWGIGIAAGVGGLVGGYAGARWGRRLPDRVLAAGLGVVATAVGLTYLVTS